MKKILNGILNAILLPHVLRLNLEFLGKKADKIDSRPCWIRRTDLMDNRPLINTFVHSLSIFRRS